MTDLNAAIETQTENQDSLAAVAYWSEKIRPGLGDLSVEGLRFLRDRYVTDVQADPIGLKELREWWRRYGAMPALSTGSGSNTDGR